MRGSQSGPPGAVETRLLPWHPSINRLSTPSAPARSHRASIRSLRSPPSSRPPCTGHGGPAKLLRPRAPCRYKPWRGRLNPDPTGGNYSPVRYKASPGRPCACRTPPPPQGCYTMHMHVIQPPTQPTISRLGPGPWVNPGRENSPPWWVVGSLDQIVLLNAQGHYGSPTLYFLPVLSTVPS